MSKEYSPRIRVRARYDRIDELGREIPDPVPMAPPVGYQRQPSLTERIRDMVRSEHLRIAALEAGQETFEEADDFEVGDDLDPSTPYEEVFDPVDSEARMRLRQADYAASVEARLGELRPHTEVTADGNTEVGAGRPREGDRSGRSGSADSKRKGQSEPKSKSSDKGSVSQASGSGGESEE